MGGAGGVAGRAGDVTSPYRIDLSDVPIVDGHGHPLFRDPWTLSSEAFTDVFSESRPGTMAAHIPHTSYFQRACRDLARHLDCDASVAAILERRRSLGPEVARRMLTDSRVTTLLIDTGYPPGAMALDEMRRTLPCAIHEVVRVETCAEALLSRALPYGQFLHAFRAALEAAIPRCVAFKSIIAYRSGLAIAEPDPAWAARAYDEVVRRSGRRIATADGEATARCALRRHARGRPRWRPTPPGALRLR
jgi:hypothetical protein